MPTPNGVILLASLQQGAFPGGTYIFTEPGKLRGYL